MATMSWIKATLLAGIWLCGAALVEGLLLFIDEFIAAQGAVTGWLELAGLAVAIVFFAVPALTPLVAGAMHGSWRLAIACLVIEALLAAAATIWYVFFFPGWMPGAK